MNTQEEILGFLKKNKSYLKERFGTKEIFLFGSFARNSPTSVSDVDLLISVEKSFKQYRLFLDMETFLASNFQRTVDIVFQESFHPLIKIDAKENLIKIE